ncbi:MAG: helix-turn-helix domain-containing protein [Proteiniphilum sp.]
MQAPNVTPSRIPVGVDGASKILGKSKQTIYHLVHQRLIPCYKNGKKLYFFEDALLSWIESGKKKTMMEIQEEADVWIARRKTPMINYRNNKRK